MPIPTNFDKAVTFNEVFENKQDFGLYFKLIGEEFIEFVDAFSEFCCCMGERELEAKVLKEAADLLYVVYGFFWAIGYDADKVFDIVHQSNMGKLGPDGKPVRDEKTGKVLKGPNYRNPLGEIKKYIDEETNAFYQKLD